MNDDLYICVSVRHCIGCFFIELEQNLHAESDIKLVKIDYDCTGYEILEWLYGVQHEYSDRIFTPSFIIPACDLHTINNAILEKQSKVYRIKKYMVSAFNLLKLYKNIYKIPDRVRIALRRRALETLT